jgi:hypothetical protein
MKIFRQKLPQPNTFGATSIRMDYSQDEGRSESHAPTEMSGTAISEIKKQLKIKIKKRQVDSGLSSNNGRAQLRNTPLKSNEKSQSEYLLVSQIHNNQTPLSMVGAP